MENEKDLELQGDQAPTPKVEEPTVYMTFKTKEELTDYVLNKVKNKEKVVAEKDNEINEIKNEIKKMKLKEYLKDFSEDTHDFISGKINDNEDYETQIKNLKEKHKSFLKNSSNVIDTIPTKEKDKKELVKEKIKDGVFNY